MIQRSRILLALWAMLATVACVSVPPAGQFQAEDATADADIAAEVGADADVTTLDAPDVSPDTLSQDVADIAVDATPDAEPDSAADVVDTAPDLAVAEIGPETSDFDIGADLGQDATPAIDTAPDTSPDTSPCPTGCDDSDPCTDDSCGDSGCLHTANTGANCDDDNPCTLGDACQDGTCTPGKPKDCVPDDPCLVGKCNQLTGKCKLTEAVGGAPCDDGSACTSEDACNSGFCQGVPIVCNDDNPCTLDGCNAASGCTNSGLSGKPCNDDNPCTLGDACVSGACSGGKPKECASPEACIASKCDPVQGKCKLSNIQDGGTCSDGSACTSGDACQGGSCTGLGVTCDDGNECTIDSCDNTSGCVMAHSAAACSDGDPCTPGDTCKAGSCVGQVASVAVLCDDDNACTTDACIAGTGCAHTPNTASCDDGNPCTTGDVCAAGTCESGENSCACLTDADCEVKNDQNPCNGTLYCNTQLATPRCQVQASTVIVCDQTGASGCLGNHCDPGSGACLWKASLDGKLCDADGSVCTQGDACVGGGCQAGTLIGCDDHNGCTSDVCSPTAGCLHNANTFACNADGNACTENDACKDKVCLPGAKKVCDDGKVCTFDACDSKSGGCSFDADALTGTACDADGSACTGGDACQAGACVAGAVLACGDGNACTNDGCDAKLGCVSTHNTQTCDDGNACTGSDLCAQGTCAGVPKNVEVTCDDGNPCTTESCDAQTGCQHGANTAVCDDGNPCTVGDVCADSACASGSNVCACASDADCKAKEDNNLCNGTLVCDKAVSGCKVAAASVVKCSTAGDTVCHQNQCTPLTGQCALLAAQDGKPCEDGSVCTSGDACAAGQCAAGKVAVCDDKNACTTDACDAQKGCIFTANSSACSDGNACTAGDACSGGACLPGSAADCDDAKVCTADSCDQAAGCVHTATAGGCSDGNACTVGDVCAAGACTPGAAPSCDDGDACTTDSCDAGKGCVHGFSTAACDDGNACTKVDLCQGGSCVGSSAVVCKASDQCHDIGTCNAASGTCSNPAKVSGAVCTDGNACTQTDTCQGGKCTGVSLVVCVASDQCHEAGVCDGGTGACSNPQKAAGSACSDGDACTAGDGCQGGACSAGAALNCEDGNVCTADSCDAKVGCVHIGAPGAAEVCNGKDDDCDGATDEADADGCQSYFADGDGDGWGFGTSQCLCAASATHKVLKDGDCDDANSYNKPGAKELCDDADNDCNGATDDAGALGCSDWYADGDGDGWGGAKSCLCAAAAPYTGSKGGDCDDAASDVHPGGSEVCDGRDNDCNGTTDDASATGCLSVYTDADGDGYGDSATVQCVCKVVNGTVQEGGDCNDKNASVNPGAVEKCNTLDDDCDGQTDEENAFECTQWLFDGDGDTFGIDTKSKCLCDATLPYTTKTAGDCDDTNSAIKPTGTELCNSKDDDCDGVTDSMGALGCTVYYWDSDGDEYGVTTPASQCLCAAGPKYRATVAGDCDDADNMIHPLMDEYCDTKDNNCDGTTDNANAIGCANWYGDADADNWGLATDAKCLCGAQDKYTTQQKGDCNDLVASVHTGAPELCNGMDDNCNGVTDSDSPQATTYYYDGDNDGWGTTDMSAKLCFPQGFYKATKGGDCLDANAAVHPNTAEVCNDLDDNCNGVTDETDSIGCIPYYLDMDADGYGTNTQRCQCHGEGDYGATVNGDCNDNVAGLHPGATELCDGIDNNCDTKIDDENSKGCATWFADVDADSYGNPNDGRCLCAPQGKYSCENSMDCDDTKLKVHPGATENCNNLDDNCNSLIDEENAVGCSTYLYDSDGDTYGITGVGKCLCAPNMLTHFTAVLDGDCDDANPATRPGAVEICDDVDNQCPQSGASIDEGCDDDDDDYCDSAMTKAAMAVTTCASSPALATVGDDCDDTSAAGNPGASEVCDGVDNNCSGGTDEGASAACSDGNACNGSEFCSGGSCLAGAALNCDDANFCTNDACSPATGCQHTAKNCDDGNACTTDSCAPGIGCGHSNLDWIPCDAGKVCNGAGACQDVVAAKGMAFIPTGTFWMGCNSAKDASCTAKTNENPQHKVTLSGYYMDLNETTVAQYKACVDASVCTVPKSVQPTQYATYPGATGMPVNFVVWAQAQQYCQWRGSRFDLPTEAQWEMAARGSCEKNGSTAGDAACAQAMRTYAWGETAPSCSYAMMSNGVVNGCGTDALGVVGQKSAGDSPYGLHDLAGNVAEWTTNCIASAYTTADQTDPAAETGCDHTTRGGAFWSNASAMRATARTSDPFNNNTTTGIRCIRTFTCATATDCDDANPNTTDTCDVSSSCLHVSTCGNATCDGEETVASCPADCAFLANHTAGSCTTPGSWDTCADGYVCVARAAGAGGNVCVADFDTWPVLPDARAVGDYTDATEYVTDAKTGLAWAKESLAGMDWSTALTACTGKSYGGFPDWRLPTAAEADGLIDFTKSQPASTALGLAWPTSEWNYWNDAPSTASGDAWATYFDNGAVYLNEPPTTNRVRCVRGLTDAQSAAGLGSRYVAADGGLSVLDRATGLRWQAAVSGTSYNWADGKTYCASNTAALPGSGWRLPTRRELGSIVDRTMHEPSIDAIFAAGPNARQFWSVTPRIFSGDAWYVDFLWGHGLPEPTVTQYRVRCVR